MNKLRPGRKRALTATVGLLTASALAVPSTASAASQTVTVSSGFRTTAARRCRGR